MWAGGALHTAQSCPHWMQPQNHAFSPDRPGPRQPDTAGLTARPAAGPPSPTTLDVRLDPRDKDGAGRLDMVRDEAYDVAAGRTLRPVELVKDGHGRQHPDTVENPVFQGVRRRRYGECPGLDLR